MSFAHPIVVCSALPLISLSASQELQSCQGIVAAFASQNSIALNSDKISIEDRWVGAGHEVRKLPGWTIKLPVPECSGHVALDVTPSCKLVKSRGLGNCSKSFPVTFY